MKIDHIDQLRAEANREANFWKAVKLAIWICDLAFWAAILAVLIVKFT